MAFCLNFAVKLLAILIGFLCLSRQACATQDQIGYRIENVWNPSPYEISVIDENEHNRIRRQSSSQGSNDTTSDTTTASPSMTTAAGSGTTMPGNVTLVPDDTNHTYYASQTVIPDSIDQYWVDLAGVPGHKALSDSHRTAITAKLKFQFKFYGHVIDNITIATGGFLYMSPFIHKFLTATQYIAPLMANFDTRLGNGSQVLYNSSGSSFVVEWRNVHLKDQNASSPFHFQTALYANGTILFLYKRLPLSMSDISTSQHPVKVGLSDAYYIDTEITPGNKKRTIYEYHRVAINFTRVREGSFTIFRPYRTCNQATDCDTCITQITHFQCKWCGIINKCSTNTDWHRQKWLDNNCESLSGSENCHLIPTVAPTSAAPSGKKTTTIGVIIVVVVILLVLIGAIGGWFYYAYTHPTSASGIWLMEHRPSQMKAKMSNMRFWKKSAGSGEKYAVESEA